MQQIKNLFLFTLLLMGALLAGCSDDEQVAPKGQFETGVLVINEGNFQQANGSVSFYNGDSAVNTIFAATNSGRQLGDVVQSVTVANDIAYVIVNNSNKVEAVDANTFESLYTIEGVKLPRFMTTFNGKGYITEWVDFGDGRVTVFDLESNMIEATITTGSGAEGAMIANGKLYVTNTFTNTVSVIDIETNTVVETITVTQGPRDIAVDANGLLWVLCKGSSDENWNPNNDGALIQIDPTTDAVVKTIELGFNNSGKLAIDGNGQNVYFYQGSEIYKMSITANASPDSPFISKASSEVSGFYSIGVDPSTGEIFAGDARGFQGNGTVYVFTTSGTDKANFEVGIGPTGFVFK